MKSIYTLLLIGGLKAIGLAQCPSITKQPVSQTDCEGNSIRMIVETNATSVQWERKRPTDGNFSAISGATTANYQIIPTGGTGAPDGTKYRAKLQTGACTIYSDEASIHLSNIVNITGTTICERSNGELIANLSAGGANQALSYQWSTSINGGSFQDISNGTAFDGANSAKLILKNASLQNQSQKFKVKVEFVISPDNDNEGSLVNQNQTPSCPRTSTEVNLTIKTAPTPTHSVATYTACAGIHTTVSSTGCSPYTTYWYNEQQVKIGEGARPSLLFSQAGVQQLKATCMKSGCESLPSIGVQVTVNPIPSKVENNGTPERIEAGSDLTFKATGGVNNIWYLNETETSPLSTASTITIKNVQPNGSYPAYISRWVSQRINGCESSKTEIKVLLETNVLPPISPVLVKDTLGKPIFIPDPVQVVDPPILNPIQEPISVEEPSYCEEPNSLPSPPIQVVSIRFDKDCERAKYYLFSSNCTEQVDYYESQTNRYLGTSDKEVAFELDAETDHTVIARCRAPYFEQGQFDFLNLKNPQINSIMEKQKYCQGDSMFINSSIANEGKFLHWEKNGHVFSLDKSFSIPADSSLFEAVYWHNDCIYREKVPPVTVYSNPSKPSFRYPKIQFCEEETLELIATTPSNKYLWSTGETENRIKINRPIAISLRVENEFGCQSLPSDTISFQQLPKGQKPHIFATQYQFCEGDTVQLYSDLGEQTIWQNGMQKAQVLVAETSQWSAHTKSKDGCWSDWSEPVMIIKQRRPEMPEIYLPFNGILRGIQKSENAALEWTINGEKKLAVQEVAISQPSQIELKSLLAYELNGQARLVCYSKTNKQFYQNIEPYDDMEVFPNPSISGKIFIHTPVMIHEGTLTVMDLKGEVVFEEPISNMNNPIMRQFENIHPGIYFLQIQTKNWRGLKRVLLLQ